MTELVRYQRRGRVGVIVLDNRPVNALGAAVRQGIGRCLDQGMADRDAEALVLVGAGRCFCGGADIREFGQAQKPPTLPEVIAKIEDCPKPVVAAIHGVALGGGLELALGCHYRVGGPSARVGLPEVKLGLIPGAGGTQRLPRLIGIAPALDVILSGEHVPAESAHALGILDRLIAGDLIEGAVAFAESLTGGRAPPPRARDLDGRLGSRVDAKVAFERASADAARRMRGQRAPLLAIESVENALRLPFDQALAREREMFMECRASEQSAAQRHVFFAEREAGKIPDVPESVEPLPVRQAAVIGCGTMGGGIAMAFADAGIPVSAFDVSAASLERGLDAIRRTYGAAAAKGRLGAAERDARMGLIRGAADYADLDDADVVIEAVFEDMELKKNVFRALDRACKPQAILATNTSSLDVNEIAAATDRPDKVMGTHFFSPAHVMRLVENVRGQRTAPETIATVMQLSRALGKIGVLVGVCDGFVGNRMYHAYTRQANFLLEEGALPQQVDAVLYEFGFAMGPFAVGDLAGLDVGWRIRQRRAATRPKGERYSPIADRICEMGRFGQKTGAGWYRYEPGSRTPIPDPEVEKLIVRVSQELGIARRAVAAEEIRERCLHALINEGAKILEEGLALRAGDIDVIWVHGYGFPIHRGGPMFQADAIGIGAVHEALSRLGEIHGEALRPAPLLERMAREGKSFRDR